MDERVARLKTPEECEQFAINVQGRFPDLARAARRRAVELRAAAHGATSAVEKEALAAVYAYERVLSESKGRKIRASRTWQMIERHGILGAVERAVSRDYDPVGYTALVEMGMQDLAFEAVVVRHPDAFSPDAVARSAQRLAGQASEGPANNAELSSPPLNTDQQERVTGELKRRRQMWSSLIGQGGPAGVNPALLRDLGIYGGAQGIWVEKSRTAELTEDGMGVTVGLLHTGSSYADDLSEDGVLYHFPKTNRAPGRDAAEVAATKAAGQHRLPVFVITYPTVSSAKRNVHLGWVDGWDDRSGLFLISFGENPSPVRSLENENQEPFSLFGVANTERREVAVRKGQQRFKFRVIQCYGAQCAACGIGVIDLLDAAHIAPKKDRGSDDPRNGLVFCATHHRAFDAGLFGIEPEGLKFAYRLGGPEAVALGVSQTSLDHLPRKPHPDAISWRWQRWRGKVEEARAPEEP